MKQKAKVDRYTYLTTTPVKRLVSSLAIPTVLSMLVTGIYNTADTFFVGRISTEATAAVGLVFSVMAIIQACGFFCGHGSGNFLSRKLGAGNRKEADEMASTGFALAVLLGVCISILGNLFLKDLARFLGASPATMEDTCRYMRIILMGAPFMTAQFVINNQLRFQGVAFYAMVGLMTGALVNIILDPILIFGLGLGVAGAAVATITGQIISFGILFWFSSQGENIHLHLKNVRFTPYYLLAIVNGGSPSLMRQGLSALATLLLNTTAGTIGGDAAIAGMSIVTRVMGLVSSALIGFAQGYQPVCSFNYGAKLTDRVKEGYYFCIQVGTVFLTLAGTLCYAFAPSIIGFFREDPAVIEIGAAALRWQAIAFPLLATSMLSNMMLQAIGKGKKATLTASARSGLFFIPLILTLPRLLGIFGVEVSQAIADVFAFLLSIPMAQSELRKMGGASEDA